MYYDPDVLELVKTTLSEDVFIEDVVILGDKNANEKYDKFCILCSCKWQKITKERRIVHRRI